MPASPPTYEGKLVTIRAIRETDKADFMARPRHPETILAYGGDPATAGPVTEAQADRWLTGRADSIRWGIEANGRLIGETRLHSMDEVEGHARIAIGIWHPDNWGHGYGTEATRLALRHAFEELKLHRVDLIVLQSNQRAIRCYEKCGFQVEGIMRERALVQGQRVNDVLMSLLAHEYAVACRNW